MVKLLKFLLTLHYYYSKPKRRPKKWTYNDIIKIVKRFENDTEKASETAEQTILSLSKNVPGLFQREPNSAVGEWVSMTSNSPSQ